MPPRRAACYDGDDMMTDGRRRYQQPASAAIAIDSLDYAAAREVS